MASIHLALMAPTAVQIRPRCAVLNHFKRFATPVRALKKILANVRTCFSCSSNFAN